jgi:hypothetical protein
VIVKNRVLLFVSFTKNTPTPLQEKQSIIQIDTGSSKAACG